MNKKFLSLVLALVMVLGTFSSVFAAKPVEKKEAKEAPKATEKVVPKITGQTEKIKWLQNEGVIEGRKVNEDPKNNDLALDKNVQRAEVSKLLVYAIGLNAKADSLKGAYKFYNDVDLSHWANGYINVGSTEPSKANGIAFLLGYPGKVFKPANDVTYAELAKMLVTLTKTDLTKDMHDKANANWPVQWMAWAHDLGIFEDVKVADSNKAVNRADAFTMIYNAMYKLGNLKQFPVNETLGIISQIKNGEITLNQGEKAKTVKLTGNTTFVLYDRRHNGATIDVNAKHRVNAILASALSNPSYYYGSLVRVIVNEKGEATHVLELGNPEQLGIVGRWTGVADEVISARATDRDYPIVRAKINYKDSDAKSISFYEGKSLNSTDLKLTSSTRYFVADVDKNQLTEVKDVDEAIRIVGNTMAAGFIDRVYAGYDVVSAAKKHVTQDVQNIQGYNEAKVVVFNKVQKDNNGTQMLRVKMDANTNYNIAYEDVNGKEVIKNVEAYRENFPANFNAKKLDVDNYSVNAANGIKIERVIEHADTDKYPIVEVLSVDGAKIIVKDEYKNTAQLFLSDSDAKIFRNGELAKGAFIQFRTLAKNAVNGDATDSNTVDVVSVMPKGFVAKGALQNVVYDNQSNQYVGSVASTIDIKKYGSDLYKVEIAQASKFYKDTLPSQVKLVILNKDDSEALIKWLENDGNKDILYKLQYNVQGDIAEALDVKVLYNGVWTKVQVAAPLLKAEKDKAAAKAFLAIVVAEEAKKTATPYAGTDEAAIRGRLEALVKEYKALSPEAQALEEVAKTTDGAKDKLNTLIGAFNALPPTGGQITAL